MITLICIGFKIYQAFRETQMMDDIAQAVKQKMEEEADGKSGKEDGIKKEKAATKAKTTSREEEELEKPKKQ